MTPKKKRTCRKCNVEKTSIDFYIRNKEKGWLCSYCKECMKRIAATCVEKNREKYREHQRKYYCKDIEARREAGRKLWGKNKDRYNFLRKERRAKAREALKVLRVTLTASPAGWK